MDDNKFKNCPFCDSEQISMKKIVKKKIKGDGIVKSTFDMWECQGCKEQFFKHWKFDEMKGTNNA